MSRHTTIIIKWYGPYSLDDLEENPDWGYGLYLATGMLKNKRDKDIHYCGITEGSFYHRIVKHHKLDQINRDQRFWIGEIEFPIKTIRHHLEIAESIIVYFWQPSLNERKKVYPPRPVTLISQWFKANETPRYRQHPVCKDLDDVLSWDGELWRTGNLDVWED